MARTQDELLRELTRKRSEALRGVLQTCGWEISDLADLLRVRRKELQIDHTDPTSAFQEALAKRQMLSIGLCTEIAVYLEMKPVEMYFEPLHQREQQTLETMMITLLPLIKTDSPAESDTRNAESHASSHATGSESPPARSGNNDKAKADNEETESSSDANRNDGLQENGQASGKSLKELRKQALEDALETADITVNELARQIVRDGEKMGTLIATIGACKRGNRFLEDELIARIAPALNVPEMKLKVRERTDGDPKVRKKRESNGQAPARRARSAETPVRRARTEESNGSVSLAFDLKIEKETLLRILEAQGSPATVDLDDKDFVITFRCPAKAVLLGALEGE